MTTPSSANPKEYVLGTGQDELERLSLQHRLWSDAAHEAWRRAGLSVGHHVLDVGCGPGFAAFDLAQLCTRSGRAVGIDESPSFIAHLNAQAASRFLPQLSGHVGDVQDLCGSLAGVAEPASFDLAYARWVLCFVRDPGAVLHGVATLLKTGGRFVINDYFNYRAMTMAPRRKSYDQTVAATVKSWEARGGDSDICARLPQLLHQAGMHVSHIEVHQRVARGSDSMFFWIDSWWRNYAPKLVGMGLLEQAVCDELLHDLTAASQNPLEFIFCPPVFEIIAVKR